MEIIKQQKGDFYEKSQLQLMYDTMVRPFLDPFVDITINYMPKLILSAFLFTLMVLATALELIDTPKSLWVGLFMLAGLDFVSGTMRAIIDEDMMFSFNRWSRTAYKMVSYAIALIATAVAGNMYPGTFGWVQLVVVAVLTGTEVFSILRNVKLAAVIVVVAEIAKSKGWPSIQHLRKMVDEKDDEIHSRHIDRYRREDTKKRTVI